MTLSKTITYIHYTINILNILFGLILGNIPRSVLISMMNCCKSMNPHQKRQECSSNIPYGMTKLMSYWILA